MEKLNYYPKLAVTAFLQVFFVGANTYCVVNLEWAGMLFCGFMISWMWSSNVKKMSMHTTTDRLVYSLSAMLGGTTGVLLFKMMLN